MTRGPSETVREPSSITLFPALGESPPALPPPWPAGHPGSPTPNLRSGPCFQVGRRARWGPVRWPEGERRDLLTSRLRTLVCAAFCIVPGGHPRVGTAPHHRLAGL